MEVKAFTFTCSWCSYISNPCDHSGVLQSEQIPLWPWTKKKIKCQRGVIQVSRRLSILIDMATLCSYSAYPLCMWRLLLDYPSVFRSTACTVAFEPMQQKPLGASDEDTPTSTACLQLSLRNYCILCVFHMKVVPVLICRHFLSIGLQEDITGCGKLKFSQIQQWIGNGQSDNFWVA